jgi:hypothetical protein
VIADPRIAAAALEGLRDGVLVVAGGEVVVANGAAHRLTGRAPGELVGGPAPAWVGAAAARGEATEVVLPAADGRRRRATVTVAPCALPNGVTGRLVTIHDRSEEVAREAKLVRRAHRDGLTGLFNKRSFEARLAEEAERLSARDRPLGLVLVDLDHFKAVNDEHGHPVGDRVSPRRRGVSPPRRARSTRSGASAARSSRGCCPTPPPTRRSPRPSARGPRCARARSRTASS